MTLPNQLTLLRVLLTPVVVLLLFKDSSLAQISALIVFIIAALTDWYDGHVARKYGYISTWGKFFDPLADKILVTTVLVCFSIFGYFPIWLIVIIVIRDAVITTLRSYAIFKGQSIVTSHLAKAKTFTQMGVLFLIFFFHLSVQLTDKGNFSEFQNFIISFPIIPLLMCLVALLTLISGLSYIIVNRKTIKEMGRNVFRIFTSFKS